MEPNRIISIELLVKKLSKKKLLNFNEKIFNGIKLFLDKGLTVFH